MQTIRWGVPLAQLSFVATRAAEGSRFSRAIELSGTGVGAELAALRAAR